MCMDGVTLSDKLIDPFAPGLRLSLYARLCAALVYACLKNLSLFPIHERQEWFPSSLRTQDKLKYFSHDLLVPLSNPTPSSFGCRAT